MKTPPRKLYVTPRQKNKIQLPHPHGHVFVEVGPRKYRLRPVVLGHIARDADGEEVRPVIEGLQPGERVVIDGAFHLNNQRKSAAQ